MATLKTTNIFERASRLRLRFDQFSVEDLWDLPLKSEGPRSIASLDSIALNLNSQLTSQNEVVSFVDESAVGDFKVQLRFDIVRHIISVKKEEAQGLLDSQQRAQMRREIDEALERKRTGSLESMTEPQLRKMRAALG